MDGLNFTSIDQAALPAANEAARQAFVSALRKVIMVDLAQDMKSVYETRAADAFAGKHGHRPVTALEARRAIRDEPIYAFWSSLRYNAQEMVWESVRPQIERNLPELRALGERTRQSTGPGSLTLDPSLSIPRYVSELDIHLMPGCFHSEYAADDIAQGAMYALGTAVFSGGLKLRINGGGVAASIANYLAVRYPDFRPARILDLGCTTGGNLLPYLDLYTDAEGYGVDVSAPVLRYAHARAVAAGKPVHFHQQNAESLHFLDDSFDLVVSSFFFHELPVEVTKRVLAECHRVLKPGGLMIHMELPPSTEVDPYFDAYLNWDAYYNNEPYYAQFRAQDLRALCSGAGFDSERYVQQRIYNLGTVPFETFAACARGEIAAPRIGNGASWFTFGAWKEIPGQVDATRNA